MNIRPFRQGDAQAVAALWIECGLTRPWNDPMHDMHRKLAMQAEWFLVGELDDRIIASAMAGYDGHRGWVYYLAVSPEHQGKGFGRQLMNEIERLLRSAGCPKINLLIRADNLAVAGFYERLGYKRDDVVEFGKRLIQDGPAAEGAAPEDAER